jgi:dihydroorotate dehydrogenase
VVYRAVYAGLLRHLPPETAHALGFWLIRAAAWVPGGGRLLRRFLAPRDPALRVHALGLDFPGPLGLAAGFDKDGHGVAGLAALGFGFVEVGTVTARPQPGNPKPRMFRFPDERALINRMGFNNAGAAALAARLRALPSRDRGLGRKAGSGPGLGPGLGPRPVIGVNIGKTKAVPEESAVADYVTSARLVADVADYVVVNVSSPNTPGLRDLQAVSLLRPLLAAVRSALDEASPRRRVPLLVKIAPDLADADIDAVADLALELGLDGIIATNTTISREGLRDSAAVAAAGPGGMSGAPLKARALEVLRRLHARTGDRLVLIAAGGIETADDAWERLQAGATLVQAYTAFIYAGPLWPHHVQAALARRLRAAGKLAARPPIHSEQSPISGATCPPSPLAAHVAILVANPGRAAGGGGNGAYHG